MPPPPCIVAFCKKNGSHNFPKDVPRRTQWIEAIEHKKPGLSIRKHSRICSDHFKPTDFSRTALALLQPRLWVLASRCKHCSIFTMLGHKMVPKYMKQLELKYDSPSYKKDGNRCLASGERALLNYNRVTKNSSKDNTAVMFYVKWGADKDDDGSSNCPIHARAIQRKKETSI